MNTYESAKNFFCQWTSKWATNNFEDDVYSPDAIEIVSLLQAIGFKIRYLDLIDPEDVSNLKDGSKGMRVTVNCVSSGVRFVLENSGECHCPNVSEINNYVVPANKSKVIEEPESLADELREAKSDLVIPISQGSKQALAQVVNQVFKYFITKRLDKNFNETIDSNRNTGEVKSEIINSPLNIYNSTEDVNSTDTCSNLKVREMSPAKYRSLDTLTGNNSDFGLPEPGKLEKPHSKQNEIVKNTCYSSPSILIQTCDETITHNFNRNTLLKEFQNAKQIILKTIENLEKNCLESMDKNIINNIETESSTFGTDLSIRTNPQKPNISTSSPQLTRRPSIPRSTTNVTSKPQIKSRSTTSLEETFSTGSKIKRKMPCLKEHVITSKPASKAKNLIKKNILNVQKASSSKLKK